MANRCQFIALGSARPVLSLSAGFFGETKKASSYCMLQQTRLTRAHRGPGTSGAGASQTRSLPRLAFSLCLVWFNKVGGRKFLSWDVARAQAGTKSRGSSAPAAGSSAREPAVGSAPPEAEPFPRLGGAKGPLTPPRDQSSACVLQWEELRCAAPSIVPSPVKSSSRSPGYRARSPMLARGISSLFWRQEDDGERGRRPIVLAEEYEAQMLRSHFRGLAGA